MPPSTIGGAKPRWDQALVNGLQAITGKENFRGDYGKYLIELCEFKDAWIVSLDCGSGERFYALVRSSDPVEVARCGVSREVAAGQTVGPEQGKAIVAGVDGLARMCDLYGFLNVRNSLFIVEMYRQEYRWYVLLVVGPGTSHGVYVDDQGSVVDAGSTML